MEENELVPVPNNSLSRVTNILKLTQKILQESSLNTEEKWTWWNNLSDEWKIVLCRSADLYNKLYSEEIINGQFNQKISEEELNKILDLESVLICDPESLFLDIIDDEKMNWSIDDLTPISKLVNLKELRIYGTQIKDISFISSLVNLEEIDLMGCEITDFGEINKLVKLNFLNLSNTGLNELYQLENLVNLKNLYLGGNYISDWDLVFLSMLIN